MTGPEHYREAERLIKGIKTDMGAVYVEDGNEQVIALAQVHATLALAAATAMGAPVDGEDNVEPEKPGKRYRITWEHLESVAKVYTRAAMRGEPPTRAVASHFSVSHSTAAKWVGHARARGAMSPVTNDSEATR